MHKDSLVAAVASFELALTRIREGDSATYLIPWPVEPITVLHALAQDRDPRHDLRTGKFELVVSRDLPGQFVVHALM